MEANNILMPSIAYTLEKSCLAVEIASKASKLHNHTFRACFPEPWLLAKQRHKQRQERLVQLLLYQELVIPRPVSPRGPLVQLLLYKELVIPRPVSPRCPRSHRGIPQKHCKVQRQK